MKIIRAIGAVLVIGLGFALAGCGTAPAYDQSITEMANSFYGQQRTYKSLELTGATEIRIVGTNVNLIVSNELQPLSIIPKDPGIAGTLITSAERVLTMGLGIYTGGEVMKTLAARPQVVSQQVVNPVIVTP